ncbi:MAG: aminotransferase class I/II-fold pyridoxal phosphate-dependent enzyme [Myxococcota bacterium]|nr:aminotransferase class I/II-fold pyridoxal phosphate-dependent enzyme [Myxococcota bacterium]
MANRDLFDVCRKYKDPELVKSFNLYPFFKSLSASDGPVVEYDGREIVMLGSNNYLGLTHHPRVMKAAHDALERFGTGCTGSRFLNGNLSLHEQLEQELAEFTGKDDALVFSSGFLANSGALSCLGSIKGAVVFSEAENHGSIIDGVRLAKGETRVFDDLDHLEQLMSDGDPDGEGWAHALVVSDAVFSMTGRVLDVKRLAELRRRFGFKLYLDDAHGLGVLGPQGRGTAAHYGVMDDIDVLFGTFSKSFASLGGFVAGDKDVINYLRHHARTVIFSAGLPPASVAAALESLRVMQEEPEIFERLWDNVEYFRNGLHDIGFDTMGSWTPILPLYVGPESIAFRFVKDALDMGVFATPVIYPAQPYQQALIRTSVTPSLTRDHLDKALDVLRVLHGKYDVPVFDAKTAPEANFMDWSYLTRTPKRRSAA